MLRAFSKKHLPKAIVDVIVSLKHVRKIPAHKLYISHVTEKRGLEVGGPSELFKTGALPLYQKIDDLDGANFADATVWEGDIKAGRNFNYIDDRKGMQFISDGTDLNEIDADTYDFVLSSNCLEHIANPLKALFEWRRVIKPGGALILVLPNKNSNFDHRRPVTPFEHILQDYNSNTREDDLTHLDEIVALHDLSMDPLAGGMENFKKRSMNNYKNRALHQHVFDAPLIDTLLKHVAMNVLDITETRADYFALATKVAQSA